MSMQTPARPRTTLPPPPRRRSPWAVVTLAIGVVLALVLATVALTRSGSTGSGPAPMPSTSATNTAPSAGPSSAPSSSPVASASTAQSPAASTWPSPSTASTAFRFLPLWPFGSVADAASWQAQAAGGHQPWRLDAGQTALSFATTYLGYTELNRVVSLTLNGDQAWVGLGGTAVEGTSRAVAVLHLARIGTGDLATRPWEVVGSQDTTLTLTTPHYGATVTGSALVVGGRITGVDESLSVQVLDQTQGRLAVQEGLPAGGTDQPWTTTLTARTTTPRLVTIAVSTGGHLARVERFAITGVWLRPALAQTG